MDQNKEDYSDFYEPFSLPLHQKPTENLDTENVDIASIDTPLSNTNIGFKLLVKMGWKENTGLGKNAEGIVDPIRLNQNSLKLGLGKEGEVEHYTSNIKRKEMESETELTEEQLVKHQEKMEKENQIKEMNKVFYCQLCNKQYKKVQDYEIHLDSLDHNHKKRFQEMKQWDKTRNPQNKAKKEEDKEMLHALSLASKAQSKPPESQQPQPPPVFIPPKQTETVTQTLPMNTDTTVKVFFHFCTK